MHTPETPLPLYKSPCPILGVPSSKAPMLVPTRVLQWPPHLCNALPSGPGHRSSTTVAQEVAPSMIFSSHKPSLHRPSPSPGSTPGSGIAQPFRTPLGHLPSPARCGLSAPLVSPTPQKEGCRHRGSSHWPPALTRMSPGREGEWGPDSWRPPHQSLGTAPRPPAVQPGH